MRMGTERLLKQVVFEMFKSPQKGDLLMDAPDVGGSWKMLCTLAWDNDKKYWKARVRELKDQPRISIKIRKGDIAVVRRSRRLAGEPAPEIETKQEKPKETEAQKYRRRDKKVTLIMQASKAAQKERWKKLDKKAKRKKKKKREMWTDKQRRVWASAHYIVNHSTAEEAEKILRSEMKQNLSKEMISQLRSMVNQS